ncbi:MAG: hypothetical protein AAF065_01690 [Verrucomicrobiota bacterium]
MGFSNFLNSKLGLTLVGGILVGGCSMLLEARIAESQGKRALAVEERAVKIEVMSDFADGISRWLTLAQPVIKKSVWLSIAIEKNKLDRDFPDGRNFDELVVHYETIRGELNALEQPESLIAKSDAVFASEDLAETLGRLRQAIEDYRYRASMENQTSLLILIRKDYTESVQLMGLELQKKDES